MGPSGDCGGSGGFLGEPEASCRREYELMHGKKISWEEWKKKAIAEPMPAFCLHDLRRTTATMLRELRFADTHLVELCLNHISGTRSGVAGIYDRSERLEERRSALENWSDWISANVAK